MCDPGARTGAGACGGLGRGESGTARHRVRVRMFAEGASRDALTFPSGPAGGGRRWRGGRVGLPMSGWPDLSWGPLHPFLCLSFPMCPGPGRQMRGG